MNISFSEKYGPWAIIAGASEGTGRAFANEIAANGVSCILIARRETPLIALASELHSKYGVECIAISADLSKPDAFDKIVEAVGDRQIGLYVSNAGADSNDAYYLDCEIDSWIDLVNRNLLVTMKCCHHYGKLMRERKRGGLLLVGSGACYSGGKYMAIYSSVKAFTLRFSESLWDELRPSNVDVLCVVLKTTDTPALRELMAKKGKPLPSRMDSPNQIAKKGLARLDKGPVYNWGFPIGFRGSFNRMRIDLFDKMSKAVLGDIKKR